MKMINDLIYTTYIKASPEKVWAAITNPEFTRQYWEHGNVSDWKIGSKWEHISKEGEVRIVGEVLENDPPKRLVLSWAAPANLADESRVTFEIIAIEDMVRLNVIHDSFKVDSTMAGHVAHGWPLVLSSMKSFIETGKGLNFWAGIGKGCSE
jgi:uncharacterized protein YndB with AHSA1/START domain